MKSNLNWVWIIVLIGLLTVFGTRQLWLSPPSPDQSHRFNTERSVERLSRILGDERPHPVDTDANDQVRERLLAEIRALGFTPQVQDDFHCQPYGSRLVCARVQNIRFWVGAPGPEAVMLASHYDSVPAGPGAADDGIGMAASLEIASLLKDRPFGRPLLVLITDGEEVGLLGAWSFVENDPVAGLVSAVVNMEARGNSGPVAMFETSHPNHFDIQGLRAEPSVPATNSLLADIYATMPNGTDMTAFLTTGMDGSNYAIASSPNFYHTPGDNLENLDRASVFHLGTSALAATEAYLGLGLEDEPNRQSTYANVLKWQILVIPVPFAVAFILTGGVLAFVAFIRVRESGWIRAFFVPPIALIIGVGLAVGLSTLVGALRPEQFYASAHPWAIRGAQTAAGLFGAALAIRRVGGECSPWRQRFSTWVWIAIIGAALTSVFGGAAILFAPALLIVGLAAILNLAGASRLAHIGLIVAGLVFLLFAMPLTAMGEMMLFPEGSAPFAIFVVLSALTFLPYLGARRNRPESVGIPIWGMAVIAAVCTIAALIVPAYSPDAPRGLSITHVTPEGDKAPYWAVYGSDPIPPAMQENATFLPSAGTERDYATWHADAPSVAGGDFNADITAQSNGQYRISTDAPSVDRLSFTFPDGMRARVSSMSGREFEAENIRSIGCHGRTCRNLIFDFVLTGESDQSDPSIEIEHLRYGLGAEGAALNSARPDWAMPQHRGDGRISFHSLTVPSP